MIVLFTSQVASVHVGFAEPFSNEIYVRNVLDVGRPFIATQYVKRLIGETINSFVKEIR